MPGEFLIYVTILCGFVLAMMALQMHHKRATKRLTHEARGEQLRRIEAILQNAAVSDAFSKDELTTLCAALRESASEMTDLEKLRDEVDELNSRADEAADRLEDLLDRANPSEDDARLERIQALKEMASNLAFRGHPLNQETLVALFKEANRPTVAASASVQNNASPAGSEAQQASTAPTGVRAAPPDPDTAVSDERGDQSSGGASSRARAR